MGEAAFDGGAGSNRWKLTFYRAVRIFLSPTSSYIDVTDTSFAETCAPNGFPRSHIYSIARPICTTTAHLPFASVSAANWNDNRNGLAGVGSVDLRGTPFSVSDNTITAQGFKELYSILYSFTNKLLRLTTAGEPGDLVASGGQLRLQEVLV
jgi:hypothetical protein